MGTASRVCHRFESCWGSHVGAKSALLRLIFLSATSKISRLPAPLLLLFTQKVTLGAPVRLQAPSRRFAVATNFLRSLFFSISYGKEAVGVCFKSALKSALLTEKGRRAASGRRSAFFCATSRQAKRRLFPCKARKRNYG